jgi:hypothetical protein
MTPALKDDGAKEDPKTDEKPVDEKPKVDPKEVSITDPAKNLSDKDRADPVKVKAAQVAAWKRPTSKADRDTLRTNRVSAARGY